MHSVKLPVPTGLRLEAEIFATMGVPNYWGEAYIRPIGSTTTASELIVNIYSNIASLIKNISTNTEASVEAHLSVPVSFFTIEVYGWIDRRDRE